MKVRNNEVSTQSYRIRKPGWGWRLCLVILCLSAALFGQSGQGSITGTVADASGAVVPGAKIVAAEAATGTAYNTVASSTGSYIFPNVKIGTYSISVEVKECIKKSGRGTARVGWRYE